MNKENKSLFKDRRVNRIAIISFVLICMSIGFICFQYYERLQSTVKAESSGYMQEIAKQMGTNVNKTINDNFSVLRTIESVLKSSKITSYKDMQAVISEQKTHWSFQKMMLIDENGVAYDDKGKEITLSNDSFLQDAIVKRTPSLSTSQVIDGKECIVFAVPLDGIDIEGVSMQAMLGTYDLSTFDKILSMTAFNGQGYAHIIRKDGTIVIRSSSENSVDTGYNILTSLSKADFANTTKYNEMKDGILNGIDGQTEFTLNDAHEYITYTALETQEWRLLTFVPVSVVNEKSDILLRITLLLCAIITITFSLLSAVLFLNFYRNKKKLEQIAYIDPITGGNTINKFYELAKGHLSSANQQRYAMIYSNIEKFKVINEQYGKQACDEILRVIEHGISMDIDSDECMGRLFADNFCVLIKYSDELTTTSRFISWQQGGKTYIKDRNITWLPLILEFGIYVIDDTTIPIAHMIDRAKLSLSETICELADKLRYAIYDEKVRQALFREKQIEDCMETALKDGEFHLFLQPKYHTQSETIGGAEALVRWITKDKMIFPDEFIPLFEKNGFIIKLDLFVFEEVCRTIRRWLDEGKDVVKISVNCSRVQLKKANFIENYSSIARKYNLPNYAIEIEITENTVFEDVEYLSNIIKEIHAAGFGCSMDDFGSGYSSLNLIKDIPVDTLKLDKIFFHTKAGDENRTESVVGSIIAMSKALLMETVAEGIEERHQVDMLKRLHCDYIQGYYFATPLPIDEFEKLAFPKVEE